MRVGKVVYNVSGVLAKIQNGEIYHTELGNYESEIVEIRKVNGKVFFYDKNGHKVNYFLKGITGLFKKCEVISSMTAINSLMKGFYCVKSLETGRLFMTYINAITNEKILLIKECEDVKWHKEELKCRNFFTKEILNKWLMIESI